MWRLIASFITLSLLVAACQATIPNIGVCYGMKGNNLPYAPQVVDLYLKYGIKRIKLYDPRAEVLTALMDSNIQVAVGIPNKQISELAKSKEAAQNWVAKNIIPYYGDIEFTHIVVGNKAILSNLGPLIAPAMLNIRNVLQLQGIDTIEVTTVIDTDVLTKLNPPSAAVFTEQAASVMPHILDCLSGADAHIMLNVYPYYVYAADPTNVRLDYAQFTAKGPVVHDRNLSYWNLYDAIVDAFIWAIADMGYPDVGVAIGESGWPAAGNGKFTTPELAQTYNKNLIKHVRSSPGTPKRPNTNNDIYIFSMFNENSDRLVCYNILVFSIQI